MNRLLCCSFCMFFAIAVAGHGDVVSVTATRTAYDDALDRVILRVESFAGANLPPAPFLEFLTGSWTFGSGAVNLTGTTSSWAYRVTNDGDSQDTDAIYPRQSWVNFAYRTSDPASRDGWVSGTLYHGFTGGFFMGNYAGWGAYGVEPVDWTPGDDGSGMDGYGFDNTLLAVFYVTPATTFVPGQTIFSGIGEFWSHGGASSPSPCDITVQIVPEPSSLVLVAIGLITVSAHLLRRRTTAGQ